MVYLLLSYDRVIEGRWSDPVVVPDLDAVELIARGCSREQNYCDWYVWQVPPGVRTVPDRMADMVGSSSDGDFHPFVWIDLTVQSFNRRRVVGVWEYGKRIRGDKSLWVTWVWYPGKRRLQELAITSQDEAVALMRSLARYRPDIHTGVYPNGVTPRGLQYVCDQAA
jgi:hypothetical protein